MEENQDNSLDFYSWYMLACYEPDKITAEDLIKFYKPMFEKKGWTMEYKRRESDRVHVFYTHPIGIPKETHNIRTVSIFTRQILEHFNLELIEIAYEQSN
jgi:mRNA deadenylase 3'-5' endonuclease subunit Ccr4